MLKKGFDAMKYLKLKKMNRIALISLAASVLFLSAGPSLTSFAAAQSPVYVTYNGSTNTLQADTPGALFKGLMPGGTSDPQNIVIRNQGGKKMNVYFQLQTDAGTEQAKALLDRLDLTVTFQPESGAAAQTLYQGPAAGKAGTGLAADLVSNPILLGSVKANSETGAISAVIHAPAEMGNEYQSAAASLKWTVQLEAVASPTESIGEESSPLVNPSSRPTESIGEESRPLSPPDLTRPPKTGQDPQFLWFVLIAALVSIAVVIVVRERLRPVKK